ncbi:MAG: Fic family protein [Chitinophagales bacterium]|nr:Fic family protein [Chitinophagales bacterium]
MTLQILPSDIFSVYEKKQRYTIHKHINEIYAMRHKFNDSSSLIASIYSSLIEGSGIDYNTYHLNKSTGYTSKGMKQIDDLQEAYQFAQRHVLNEANFLKTHILISKNLDLDKKFKGKYRSNAEVQVGNHLGTIYTGCASSKVESAMKKLFEDIKTLKSQKLTYNQAFYYASMIHLVLVKIQPFADGNGRAARLLEKWFLSEILSNKIWYIQSEAYYLYNREKYYSNLQIGDTFETVDYGASSQFLLMLTDTFKLSKKGSLI